MSRTPPHHQSTISIRADLLLSLFAIVVLLVAGIVGTMAIGARRSVQSLSAQHTQQTLRVASDQLNSFFGPIESALRTMTSMVGSGRLSIDDPDALDEFLVLTLEEHRHLSSVLVANADGDEVMLLREYPGTWRRRQIAGDAPGAQSWAVWSNESMASPQESQVSDQEYRTHLRPWYVQAKEAFEDPARRVGSRTGVLWTNPYEFHTTHDYGITASCAVELPDGSMGVVAFDVLLAELSRFTGNLQTTPHGMVFVLTSDDVFIAVPRRNPEMQFDPSEWMLQTPSEIGIPIVVDAARALGEDFDDRLPDDADDPSGLPAQATSGELRASVEEFQRRDDDPPTRFNSAGRSWWGDARFLSLGANSVLIVAVVVPEQDLLGSIEEIRLWIVLILVGVVIIAVFRAVLVARRVTEPIESIVAQSRRISRGDLATWEPISTKVKEVLWLEQALERMRTGLQSLLKLENDLALAREIQQRTFPTDLPELPGFDVAAWSEPADETGGDTYDIIGIVKGESSKHDRVTSGVADRAVLLLADATGHGIGPAISVTQLRSMIRIAARAREGRLRMLDEINDQLVEDLPEGRFITAWFGAIDCRAGTFHSVSAGQGPLLHYHASTGEVTTIAADTPPLGVVAGMEIPDANPVELAAGDVFAVISDGIFEAEATSGELFGTARVVEVLRAHAGEASAAIVDALRAAATSWSVGMPQRDDQTCLVVRRISE